MTNTTVNIRPALPEPVYITRAQLAKRHQTTVGTLASEACNGRPRVPVYKFGARVLHRLTDVEAYEASALQASA